MTLSETLTASSLLTLVMGLTLGTLQPGLAVYRKDMAQGNLDQLTGVVARQFAAEVECAPKDSLSQSGERLSFLQYQGYDAHSGQPIWDRYRLWWRDAASNTLHAADIASPKLPSLSAYPLTAAEMTALPRSHDRVVLRGVHSWQSAFNQGTVNLDLTVEDSGGTSHCQVCVRMRL